jgi:hypothetical protein
LGIASIGFSGRSYTVKIDVQGYNGAFIVKNSETQEVLEGVKSVTLYLNKGGLSEALIYVSVAKVDVRGIPRHDGVRAG